MVFVTTHIPLAEVPRQVTFDRIVNVTRLLDQVVRREGGARPRLAAAALNPHAGENGCMGKEDEETVKPALAALRAEGIDIDGPFPPDTLFIEETRRRYDGIVSMYHDQGHIPFKMLAFDRGVNSTLGLPVVRTSPDPVPRSTSPGRGWPTPAASTRRSNLRCAASPEPAGRIQRPICATASIRYRPEREAEAVPSARTSPQCSGFFSHSKLQPSSA